VSSYTVHIIPGAWSEVRDLPGHVRQRVRRAISELATNPRPPHSQPLEASGFPRELRRLRLDRWRIVYAVSEAEQAVDVLAVRKRPPYDYGDLEKLLDTLR
jgi:mRNA interferase RelE/StbE